MRRTKYTPELLAPLVASSVSFTEVSRKLGIEPNGGNHRLISARIRQAGLDTSHFVHKRGRATIEAITAATHPSVAKVAASLTYPDRIVFVENGPSLSGPSLAKRLVAMGWPYRCATCGIADWCGKPLVLHVDHINGVHNDQRLVNLRLLCPNCHSQTDTYCNKAREWSPCYMSALTRACWNW